MVDERMYKITLIEDLNKIKVLMLNECLTVQEFDELYDMSVVEVEMLLSMNNMIMRHGIPA